MKFTHANQIRPERCRHAPRAGGAAQSAFTLVELIAVMALLVTVIALAAPSLGHFFRGRAVDAEARRLMSLTRLGQSRAASEGIPMILWIDVKERAYGLEADASYADSDPKAVEYGLDGNVTAELGVAGAETVTSSTLFGNEAVTSSRHGSLPHIRLEPDGGIAPSSPEHIRLADRDGGSLWVTLGVNRLSYEIRNQPTQRTAVWR